ncbi:hypothetical protein GCM10027590_38910 [Nocardiopsis nanhaiensis]
MEATQEGFGPGSVAGQDRCLLGGGEHPGRPLGRDVDESGVRVGRVNALGGAGDGTAPVHELANTGVGAQVLDGPAEKGLVESDLFGLGGVRRGTATRTEADDAGFLPVNARGFLLSEHGREGTCIRSSDVRHDHVPPAGSLAGGKTLSQVDRSGPTAARLAVRA